jgi:hypothetical protein
LKQLRSEAAEICDGWADERASCGDPEGAEILREAGLEIRRLSLTNIASPTGDA